MSSIDTLIDNGNALDAIPEPSGHPAPQTEPKPNGSYTSPATQNDAPLNGKQSHVIEEVKPYQLLERSIDDLRTMRVVVIGCGYSGVIAGIRFPEHVQNLELVIYEAQSDVGGTWYV